MFHPLEKKAEVFPIGQMVSAPSMRNRKPPPHTHTRIETVNTWRTGRQAAHSTASTESVCPDSLPPLPRGMCRHFNTSTSVSYRRSRGALGLENPRRRCGVPSLKNKRTICAAGALLWRAQYATFADRARFPEPSAARQAGGEADDTLHSHRVLFLGPTCDARFCLQGAKKSHLPPALGRG